MSWTDSQSCVRVLDAAWGVEAEEDLTNLTEDDVADRLKQLVEKGEAMERSPECIPKDRDIIDDVDVRRYNLY